MSAWSETADIKRVEYPEDNDGLRKVVEFYTREDGQRVLKLLVSSVVFRLSAHRTSAQNRGRCAFVAGRLSVKRTGSHLEAQDRQWGTRFLVNYARNDSSLLRSFWVSFFQLKWSKVLMTFFLSVPGKSEVCILTLKKPGIRVKLVQRRTGFMKNVWIDNYSWDGKTRDILRNSF